MLGDNHKIPEITMKNKYSKKVKLHPWVGENYLNAKPRILILGLSMYNEQGEFERGSVKSMIQSIRDETWTYSFFTKIGHAFSNENHWDENGDGSDDYYLNKNEFWNYVAFYEYLQHVFNHPKESIDPIHYENAKEPFIEIVKILSPDIILTMGFGTCDNLPQDGEYVDTYKHKGLLMEVWKYTYQNKKSYVCRIQHPSSVGFKTWDWGELFTKFLNDFHGKIT